jgi:hypothetical protein
MKQVSFLRKPVAFEGRYTAIPNTWARDERLGYRAKGILLLLMSHQSGWRISLEHLANDGPDGMTAVRTAIGQLQDNGYLVRRLIKDERQRIEGSEWIIHDPFDGENLKTENRTENLTTENPPTENRRLKKPNIKETNNKKPKELSYTDVFESFWQMYPRKIGKGATKAAFDKALGKATAEEILDGCTQYAQSGKLPEMQFIPHPTTWLNQERWLDDLTGLATKRNPTTTAVDILRRSAEMNRKEVE